MSIYHTTYDRGVTVSVVAGSGSDGRPNLIVSFDDINGEEETCNDSEAAPKNALSWLKVPNHSLMRNNRALTMTSEVRCLARLHADDS
jgi:hypothetical protein